jgi:hypothetical protein
MPRRWRTVTIATVLVAAATALLARSSDAGPWFYLPYRQGNAVVPVGPDMSVRTTCSGDVAHLATCAGSSCTEVATFNCLPYTCDRNGLQCTASCVSDSDCGQGAVCNTTRGECASTPATCADTFAVKTADGMLVSCGPYKCLNGACQQQCVTSNDCAAGFTCRRAPSSGRYYCGQGA